MSARSDPQTPGWRCLFCHNPHGASNSEEHVLLKSLGNDVASGLVEREIVVPPGVVCDKCNGRRLSRVDDALASWPPLSIFRSLGQVRNRKRALVDAVEGTRWMVYSNPKDERDFVLAVVASTTAGSGRDDVARAMCKIAVEICWLNNASDAAHARWDPIRQAALGGPLPGDLALRLTLPRDIHDVNLVPDVHLFATPVDSPLKLVCRVLVVGLTLDLFVGDDVVADVDRAGVWRVDEATGKLSGPKSVWATFRGRAERSVRRPVDPSRPAESVSRRHRSRLPTHEAGIDVELRPSSRP